MSRVPVGQLDFAALFSARRAEADRRMAAMDAAQVGHEGDRDFVTCSSCGQVAAYVQRGRSHVVAGLHCGIYC